MPGIAIGERSQLRSTAQVMSTPTPPKIVPNSRQTTSGRSPGSRCRPG
ncbi:hypothetical protein MOQ72_15635 [Saccharopolyspora sp. K220]|nr:hypothetical protein [Saccharopolyspora soli]MCI2418874.1 hypothetical protein [Saccharopolyspora soli]